MSNDKVFRLLGMFFLALFIFNYPILSLFGRGEMLGGIPVLFIYIFISWSAIIFFTAQIVESKKNNRPK
ncbi:MAG: hypothetical protein KDD10_01980 [Phaeodactylibacter sp.]|nr:hypothetical protein [Phaeodactylibacter sp.]MCB9291798.1 hypothetical protein [Lewinellaceae bacterium]